jgi:hypothetical protein
MAHKIMGSIRRRGKTWRLSILLLFQNSGSAHLMTPNWANEAAWFTGTIFDVDAI